MNQSHGSRRSKLSPAALPAVMSPKHPTLTPTVPGSAGDGAGLENDAPAPPSGKLPKGSTAPLGATLPPDPLFGSVAGATADARVEAAIGLRTPKGSGGGALPAAIPAPRKGTEGAVGDCTLLLPDRKAASMGGMVVEAEAAVGGGVVVPETLPANGWGRGAAGLVTLAVLPAPTAADADCCCCCPTATACCTSPPNFSSMRASISRMFLHEQSKGDYERGQRGQFKGRLWRAILGQSVRRWVSLLPAGARCQSRLGIQFNYNWNEVNPLTLG